MGTLQTILAIIGSLLLLTATGAAIWAVFRSTSQDARIKRLQDERDDYLSRLNFIEPKVKALEQQNELLMSLHNPAEQIQQLSEQEQRNHAATFELLQKQNDLLEQLHEDLDGRAR